MKTIPEPFICDICKKVHPKSDVSGCDVWCKEQTDEDANKKKVKE